MDKPTEEKEEEPFLIDIVKDDFHKLGITRCPTCKEKTTPLPRPWKVIYVFTCPYCLESIMTEMYTKRLVN